MEKYIIDPAAIPAADDATVIRIREALRDRQAKSAAGSARAAIPVDSHSRAVLATGPL